MNYSTATQIHSKNIVWKATINSGEGLSKRTPYFSRPVEVWKTM